MTDKEKIELIIQEKHLNNTQFCNEVCIAPGTLSHIRSGRTEPTLNILRSIAQAFPDINPAWLFYGEEPMYKKTDAPTHGRGDVGLDADANNHGGEGTAAAEDGQLSLGLFAANQNRTPTGTGVTGNISQVLAPDSSDSAHARRPVSAPASLSALHVQEIVAETLRQQQKPQRKVVEVRIFFDDGTFETFGAQ